MFINYPPFFSPISILFDVFSTLLKNLRVVTNLKHFENRMKNDKKREKEWGINDNNEISMVKCVLMWNMLLYVCIYTVKWHLILSCCMVVSRCDDDE